MLKNQRPYQWMMSKTDNVFISGVIACAAKIVGCSSAFVLSKIKGRKLTPLKHEEAQKKLQDIFPKPLSDDNTANIQKVPSDVDVSVIVPAYNAEQYIRACIDSILNQKTDLDVQVIIVNDKSTDATGQILLEYKDILNVVCADNPNPGSAAKARNFGLSLATGEYIMFVDSDDVLLPNAIEKLFRTAKARNADVVQGGWKYIDENDDEGCIQLYADELYDGKKRTDILDLPGMPWGKLFEKKLFDDVRFPSGFTCYEDAIIHFLIFRKAKRVSSVDECIYGWRKNMNGLTYTSKGAAKSLQAYWIVEELLDEDNRLELPHDEIFERSLTMQLSNFCYSCIKDLGYDVQLAVFNMCADLYNKYDINARSMPFALKLASRALKKYDFETWRIQGKWFSLMR